MALAFAASLAFTVKPEKVSTLTVSNLKAAFEGESTASAKYAAYAKKAKEEGYPRIALLFEAASQSEAIHANNHKSALSEMGQSVEKIAPKFEVKSTKENLQDAIKGETYEVTTMYPEFIKASADGIEKISLNYAYLTEKKHKEMYRNALEQLEAGKEGSLSGTYAVCTTCGNTYDGPAPNRCGISMTPKDRFKIFKL
ncbi:MAG: rubrerythrin family protein [Ignavibacteria bacterium]|nr:rubrerythrin family protein [Ignavibacteria bacterium]MCU7502664.1 rubrerythrin family protein [Ignavibacteria bacterium]MCU7515133.1 rubrerythrin family protein [Ignavibacteria bacterium]